MVREEGVVREEGGVVRGVVREEGGVRKGRGQVLGQCSETQFSHRLSKVSFHV